MNKQTSIRADGTGHRYIVTASGVLLCDGWVRGTYEQALAVAAICAAVGEIDAAILKDRQDAKKASEPFTAPWINELAETRALPRCPKCANNDQVKIGDTSYTCARCHTSFCR